MVNLQFQYKTLLESSCHGYDLIYSGVFPWQIERHTSNMKNKFQTEDFPPPLESSYEKLGTFCSNVLFLLCQPAAVVPLASAAVCTFHNEKKKWKLVFPEAESAAHGFLPCANPSISPVKHVLNFGFYNFQHGRKRKTWIEKGCTVAKWVSNSK